MKIFLKANNGVLKAVNTEDIEMVESRGDYVHIHIKHTSYIVHSTMNNAEQKFGLTRVHRSYLVNMNKVTEIDDRLLMVGGRTVPMSRRYYKKVIKSINTL